MTGDIRTILASSDAAESLRMERFVARCFQERQWPASRGVYFVDPETGKSREIDVISRHVLDRPRRHKGIGAPIINISVICECKSLAGWNVLFSEGDVESPFKNKVDSHWSGYEEHIRALVEEVSQDSIYPSCNKNMLYTYLTDRAYPDHAAIAFDLHLPPPPVEMVATAFRETKSGTDEKHRSARQGSINPLWSAIQSVLSATKAADLRSLDTMRSYTIPPISYADDIDQLVYHQAFFFDVELMRHVCYHPVIFCKARLFRLTEDSVDDVRSVRLQISNLSFNYRYVDVVNFDAAASYIDKSLTHFERHSSKAIRKTWNKLEDLEWEPAQSSHKLAQALGLSSNPEAYSPEITDQE